MIGISGWTARTLATICRVGSRLNRRMSLWARAPAQESNSCRTSAPASTCWIRYWLVASTSSAISAAKSCCRPYIQLLALAKSRLDAAFDHVGRHRPRRAGKPDQRRLRRQLRPEARHRLIDRAQMLMELAEPELRQVLAVLQRLQHRAAPFLEADLLAQGIRHHQDVGEQDRRIEAEAPDRLQRHLGCQHRVVAKVQERARRRPGPAIFRQIAPGLAHEPDRRALQRFAFQGPDQELVGFFHERFGR